jgi:hypothetical protein
MPKSCGAVFSTMHSAKIQSGAVLLPVWYNAYIITWHMQPTDNLCIISNHAKQYSVWKTIQEQGHINRHLDNPAREIFL